MKKKNKIAVKNYFICSHATDLYLINYFINKLKLKKEDNILFYYKDLTKIHNLKLKDIKNLNKNFEKKIDFNWINLGFSNSFSIEILKNFFKNLQNINKVKKKINNLNIPENSNFYFGRETTSSISSRIILSFLKKNNYENIFTFGIKEPYTNHNYKISFKSNMIDNFFNFFGVTPVSVRVNEKNVVMQKNICQSNYKKEFIFSKINKKIGKKIFVNLDISRNKKSGKKKIIFVDRGINILRFYPKSDKKKYIETLQKVIYLVSKKYKSKFELIFKMHPRQNHLDINTYAFKVKFKKIHMEQILEKLKDEIYCIIGITSTALRISDIYGIKSYTTHKLFNLGENKRLSKTIMNNSEIKSIENFKDFLKI